MRLSHEIVVVTGGAGGLGAALCRCFANAGARVAVLDRDAAAAEVLAQALRSAGGDALGLGCDVSDLAQVAAAMARVESQFGGITVLVNNAGISSRCLFEASQSAVAERVMAVNYFGALHCTEAALPVLLAARGRIVAISSVAGFSPLIGRSAYAASKHALHGFFDSLRSEVADRGVSVTLVCPSFIATGIEAAALGGDGRPLGQARAVAGRVAGPDEIAARVVRACMRRDRLCLPDAMSRAAYLLSRTLPRLYESMMRRRVGGEFN